MPDLYEKMTNEEFCEILWEIVGSDHSAVPGAYEVFAEEYNNEVLGRWEEQHPEYFENDDEGDDDA